MPIKITSSQTQWNLKFTGEQRAKKEQPLCVENGLLDVQIFICALRDIVRSFPLSAEGSRIDHFFMTLYLDKFSNVCALSTEAPRGGQAVAWAVTVRQESPARKPLNWLSHPAQYTSDMDNNIVIWLASILDDVNGLPHTASAFCLSDGYSIVDSDEKSRMARFRHVADQQSYLASHAAIRIMLGNAVGREAASLKFSPSPNGKPVLSESTSLDFSISHARGVVAVALASSAVGIDVEPIRIIDNLKSLVDFALSPDEQTVLKNEPESSRSELFLRYWTIKEAVLKAAGLGFSIPPNLLTVDPGPEPAVIAAPSQLGDSEQWYIAAGIRHLIHRP